MIQNERQQEVWCQAICKSVLDEEAHLQSERSPYYFTIAAIIFVSSIAFGLLSSKEKTNEAEQENSHSIRSFCLSVLKPTAGKQIGIIALGIIVAFYHVSQAINADSFHPRLNNCLNIPEYYS